MIVAVHQPNFVPWMPFFLKMAAADKMVIMQHCQFEKGGYQNRFRFNEQWFTMSAGPKSLVPIEKKVYLKPDQDWAAIKGRLPQFRDKLREMDELIGRNLVMTNVDIIRHIADKLGITTPIDFDYPTEKRATARLVDICKHYGATRYLAGPSGKGYMDLQQFHTAGIDVRFHEVADKRHSLEVYE